MPPVLVFRESRLNRNGIRALVCSLRRKGYPSEKIRFARTEEEIRETVETAGSERPVVLFSFMTHEAHSFLEEASRIREIAREKVLTVAGGPDVTARENFFSNFPFDIVIRGEGEISLAELLIEKRWRMEGRSDKRDGAPLVIDGRRVDSLADYPSFDEMSETTGPVELIRGCRHVCTYCQTPRIFGNRERHRTVESVLEHVRVQVKKKALNIYFLAPDAFSYRPEPYRSSTDAIGDLLERTRAAGIRNISFGTFPSEVRPDSVNEEILSTVRKLASNRVITVGAQSGADSVLSRTGRGHRVEDVRKAVELIRAHGFRPVVDFIIAFPDESEEEMFETARLAEELIRKEKALARFHYFMPLPGTPSGKCLPSKIPARIRARLEHLKKCHLVEGDWELQEKIWNQMGAVPGKI